MIYYKKVQIFPSETLDIFWYEFLTDTINNCKFNKLLKGKHFAYRNA